jgi:hypothetical protein
MHPNSISMLQPWTVLSKIVMLCILRSTLVSRVLLHPCTALQHVDPKLYHEALDGLKKLRKYLADREGIANTHTLFSMTNLEDIASCSYATTRQQLSNHVKGVAMSKWSKYGDLILGVSVH